jgi:cation diffusion facilitator family transporter
MDMEQRMRDASRVTWMGFFVNLILAILKMIAGIFGRSSALIADSIHSISDLATDIVVLFGIKAAGKPEDETHRYGHGKIETLITLLVGVILILVGVGILYAASIRIMDVIQGEELEAPGYIALAAAAISIVSKEGIFWYTRSVARRTDSNVLMANAWHHRTDSLSSIATFLGVGGAILLGGRWSILDPIAAALVTVLIFWVSIKLVKSSLNELLDASLDKDSREKIMKIASRVRGVKEPHNLKTRSLGNKIAIDLHIKVDSGLSVRRAHDICLRLENLLKKEFGTESIINIHVDPLED